MKSLAVIWDSVFAYLWDVGVVSQFPLSGMKINPAAVPLQLEAGASLYHYYYCKPYCSQGTDPPLYASYINTTSDYIWISIGFNDVSRKGLMWSEGIVLPTMVSQYIAFIDSLHAAGYKYSSIIFHFKYPAGRNVLDEYGEPKTWGDIELNGGPIGNVEVPVSTYAQGWNSVNTNTNVFKTLMIPELQSRGVLYVDEFQWVIDTYGIDNTDEFILPITGDGIHIGKVWDEATCIAHNEPYIEDDSRASQCYYYKHFRNLFNATMKDY